FQHFIVLDTHMERAFGLPKGTFGSGGRKNEAYYDAAERVIAEIANRLGERPEDVQAAIWHVQRSLPQGRSLGVAPPGNYATLLDSASTWAEQSLIRKKERLTHGVRGLLATTQRFSIAHRPGPSRRSSARRTGPRSACASTWSGGPRSSAARRTFVPSRRRKMRRRSSRGSPTQRTAPPSTSATATWRA